MTKNIFQWLLLAVIVTQGTFAAKQRKPKKESRQTNTMEYLMEQRGIVPYVFPAGPRDSLMLRYPYINPLRGIAGQVLSHEYCQTRPVVEWNGRVDSRYTLAMIITDFRTELDSSNNTVVTHYKEYVQWLVVNIPKRNYRDGKLIVRYSVPMTPLTNGTSYLVFLVYRQSYRFNQTVTDQMEYTPINNDGSFRIFNFCWKYDMRYPDAGFFYTLRYDVNTTTTVFTTSTKAQKIKKKPTKRFL